MGWHYNVGTHHETSSHAVMTALEKNVNEVHPKDDGTVDIELTVRGRNGQAKVIHIPNQNAAELKSTMKLSLPADLQPPANPSSGPGLFHKK